MATACWLHPCNQAVFGPIFPVCARTGNRIPLENDVLGAVREQFAVQPDVATASV